MTATLVQPPVTRTSLNPLNVAAPPPVPPPSPDLVAFRESVVRFTWSDLEKMWQAGILYEDSTTELLDGILVYRDCRSGGTTGMATGIGHDWAVGRLGDLSGEIDAPTRHIRTQTTLRLSDTYDPVPDAMIVRGPLADYRRRQPTGADVLCLIEVADSSYARDSVDKLTAYARAGIPQYIIIDLRHRLAEVYANPDAAGGTYAALDVIPGDGVLRLRVGTEGETFDVPLADLLP